MNKYEHADTSARLFGGKSKEYEEFHALIDSNKLVTPSIFGRFFLHHIDVGLPIVERVLGTHIGSLKVPTRSLFIQHLLEDYGCVPTFKNDWSNAFKANMSVSVQLNDWNKFVSRASRDSRIESLNESNLRTLDNLFNLKGIIPGKFSVELPTIYAIFGHALGADLLARVVKKKFLFKNVYTLDALTGYLNCRFKPREFVDFVPTLLDWEKHVEDERWMHAPKRAEKKATHYIDLYQRINNYDPKDEKYLVPRHSTKRFKKFLKGVVDDIKREREMFPRQPCNLD
jgi:hypothetical protein